MTQIRCSYHSFRSLPGLPKNLLWQRNFTMIILSRSHYHLYFRCPITHISGTRNLILKTTRGESAGLGAKWVLTEPMLVWGRQSVHSGITWCFGHRCVMHRHSWVRLIMGFHDGSWGNTQSLVSRTCGPNGGCLRRLKRKGSHGLEKRNWSSLLHTGPQILRLWKVMLHLFWYKFIM